MKKIISIFLILVSDGFAQNNFDQMLYNKKIYQVSTIKCFHEQSKLFSGNTTVKQDRLIKEKKSFKKDVSIYLSGGITFSKGFRDSFTNYFESNDYEITSKNLNFFTFEAGAEFKIISHLYGYGKFKFFNSKIKINYSETNSVALSHN